MSRDFADGASVGQWLEVIEKLNAGEMPPATERDRPTAQESGRIVAWLSARIEEGTATRLAKRQAVSFNRLTRQEYANTIYDLLGVHFDVADPAGLNEDDSWRGFARIGSTLTLSASHVERFFAAAERILLEAYPDSVTEPFVVKTSALDLLGGPRGYDSEQAEQFRSSGVAEKARIDLWPGQVIRAQPPGGWVEPAGQYRIRVQVSGLRPSGGRAPHIAFLAANVDRLLFEQDVIAPEGQPTVIEFDAHLPAGEHQFTVSNAVPGPAILARLGRSRTRPFLSLEEGRIPWQVALKDNAHKPLYPLLIVDWIEWAGPLSTGHERTRNGYMPENMSQARASLHSFAERAFRRPLKADEVEKYVEIVRREISIGEDLRSAMRTSMLAILCSNRFLYLIEGAPERDAAILDDWELASRLSYFLWSTMPDAELIRLSRNGQLRQPEVLEGQVARMLDDPKIGRFADTFSHEWLQLERVGMFTPDSELYPEYDKYLERSMVRETTAFFGRVLEENLTLREFLVSDWTMLNPRLALHYGIPGVTESGFQRVSLATGDHHRSGILTQASILSLTSDGTRHRPVHRGVWLSEAILGKSPPPPPANVEPIEPSRVDGPKPTIRAQLEEHRSSASCAVCHRKIDPLGFAFDNYDAIGRWRTEEVVAGSTGPNPKVDASGSLPDGRTFSNAAELQQLLLEDIDEFNTAFVAKLATFALRRAMAVADRGELSTIAAASKANGYRLRDVIRELVVSDLFLER